MRCAIYDFETLGQNFETAPVLSIGFLEFDFDRFITDTPYTYDELLSICGYEKFDSLEQIQKYNKKVEKSTIDWWKRQGEAAQKVLLPNKSLDVSIKNLFKSLTDYFKTFKDIEWVFTRGNTFDPMFLFKIMKDIHEEDPFPWWSIRDTRSFLDALLITTDMNNKFLLPEWEEKFIHHDARHDIVVDVLRMQEAVRAHYYDN